MDLDDFLETDIVNFLDALPTKSEFDPVSEDNIDMLLFHGAYSRAVSHTLNSGNISFFLLPNNKG